MRMWMVNPALMCRKHLLGEHVELHMLFGSLKRGRSIKGFLEKGLLEPKSLMSRHEALVKEMVDRGYKHHSAIGSMENLPRYDNAVNVDLSLKELVNRCPECRLRVEGNFSNSVL